MADGPSSADAECPICAKKFPVDGIEVHVNRCIFLNCSEDTSDESKHKKRSFGIFNRNSSTTADESASKKVRGSEASAANRLASPSTNRLASPSTNRSASPSTSSSQRASKPATPIAESTATNATAAAASTKPLAERMRPESIDDYIGQEHITGKNTILRNILEKNDVPSMILWGPPGVGKTTLAHIIANRCKQTQSIRFVKLSATMAGVNDIKQAVTVAKNEQKFKHKTILFMDEIHRFNKLQQDIFLPHVESGLITLIGATTENPSFSLNSALLSRCRVVLLNKLSVESIMVILQRSLKEYKAVVVKPNEESPSIKGLGFIPEIAVEASSIKWLSEICDGDARIALNSLQLAIDSLQENCDSHVGLKMMPLSAIQDGIKRSHMMYDQRGDQHYDIISALHKSIRASDDNAALYWCTRMMVSGEDPRYICRRMIRAASEDIGLADPKAVSIAVAALDAVQSIGMPEADCIIAQTAVYLARAPKSQEVYKALGLCKRDIEECKGAQPSVPLHLRNAPTKLMRELNYGKGYNGRHKEYSGLEYMPEGMEDRNYF